MGRTLNYNISLICDECGNQTNCRVGLSNRDFQPLKFSCKNCGTIIGINITAKGARGIDNKAIEQIISGKSAADIIKMPEVKIEIKNASEVKLEGMFNSKLDFVDLHLDFPVIFGAYVPGMTPYMRAAQRSGAEAAAFHRDRLELINEQYKKYPQVAELITKYTKRFYGPFCTYAKNKFNIDVKSKKMEDINSALYTIVSRYTLPFTLPNDSIKLSEKFTTSVMDLMIKNENSTIKFLQELIDTKFLQNLQRDCLKVYKPIFDAELPLRPALFLDVDTTYSKNKIAMRVSSHDFFEYREVYKDMAEVLSRQLVLVAGMGNLIERGDHNSFAVRTSANGKQLSPTSLNSYADVSLGNKLLDLDSQWHTIDSLACDNEIRNAIAHNKIDYDDSTQIITYFPKLEGMEREKERSINLLEYTHRMLTLFRELHRLHHLVKCLNYATLLEPFASKLKH